MGSSMGIENSDDILLPVANAPVQGEPPASHPLDSSEIKLCFDHLPKERRKRMKRMARDIDSQSRSWPRDSRTNKFTCFAIE